MQAVRALASIDLPPQRTPSLGAYLRFVWAALRGSRRLFVRKDDKWAN